MSILTYDKLSKIFNNENNFTIVNKGFGLERFSSIIGNTVFSYSYTDEKRNEYFKNLERNTSEVSDSVLNSIFGDLMTELKCIPELLNYEHVKDVFKKSVINTIKYNHKEGYLRASFMNAFLSEFDFDKSLTLNDESNRVFFKDVFKTYLEKAKKNETFVAYYMLKNIIFDQKDKLPTDFVNEIGAIYLSNNIFKFKKEDIKKTKNIEDYFLKQDLLKYAKDNKNLMNILNKDNVIEVKCYKFMIDYVEIGNETKTKPVWIKDNYRHAIEYLSNKTKETSEIQDFFSREENNQMIVYLTFTENNIYVKSIKQFFNEYNQGLNDLKNINLDWPEKLFEKIRLENKLESKQKVKSLKI